MVALPAAAEILKLLSMLAARRPRARVDQALAEATFLSIAEVLCHLVRGRILSWKQPVCSSTHASMSDMRAALSVAYGRDSRV